MKSEFKETITIEFTTGEYNSLLFFLSYAAACFLGSADSTQVELMRFLNLMNTGNPNFIPYRLEDNWLENEDKKK